MARLSGLAAFLLISLLAHAGAAYGASTPSSPSDPSAGSPAGSVYQLPFEEGRSDGAPKGTGGTSAGGGPGGGGNGGGPGTGASATGEPSTYRSENNFGSSSEVPGVDDGNGSQGQGGGSGQGSGGGSGSGQGSGSGSGSGTGSGSGSESQLGAAELSDSGNTSPAANIGLLVLILLVAGGVAFLTMRGRSLKRQS
jgi:hypothetical protein